MFVGGVIEQPLTVDFAFLASNSEIRNGILQKLLGILWQTKVFLPSIHILSAPKI